MSELWGPKSIQALTGAVLVIGVWVGGIQARLNGKADKSKIARDPVEADTVRVGIAGLSQQIDSMEKNFDKKYDAYTKRVERLENRLLDAITSGRSGD